MESIKELMSSPFQHVVNDAITKKLKLNSLRGYSFQRIRNKARRLVSGSHTPGADQLGKGWQVKTGFTESNDYSESCKFHGTALTARVGHKNPLLTRAKSEVDIKQRGTSIPYGQRLRQQFSCSKPHPNESAQKDNFFYQCSSRQQINLKQSMSQKNQTRQVSPFLDIQSLKPQISPQSRQKTKRIQSSQTEQIVPMFQPQQTSHEQKNTTFLTQTNQATRRALSPNKQNQEDKDKVNMQCLADPWKEGAPSKREQVKIVIGDANASKRYESANSSTPVQNVMSARKYKGKDKQTLNFNNLFSQSFTARSLKSKPQIIKRVQSRQKRDEQTSSHLRQRHGSPLQATITDGTNVKQREEAELEPVQQRQLELNCQAHKDPIKGIKQQRAIKTSQLRTRVKNYLDNFNDKTILEMTKDPPEFDQEKLKRLQLNEDLYDVVDRNQQIVQQFSQTYQESQKHSQKQVQPLSYTQRIKSRTSAYRNVEHLRDMKHSPFFPFERQQSRLSQLLQSDNDFKTKLSLHQEKLNINNEGNLCISGEPVTYGQQQSRGGELYKLAMAKASGNKDFQRYYESESR